MAIYHLTAKMVKRSEGRNAVAAAAYRSGSLLYDEATGITHDYTRKVGVEHTEILAPDEAPAWVFDRGRLWNAVEAAETRKDAQVAREIEVGLPVELSRSEQVALLRDFVKREFVAKGMIADIGVHLDNPHNPHAHLLLTTRTLTSDGFGSKNRGWNETQELLGWRRGWAEVTNEHLVEAGLGVRIDHRSYQDQQLSLIPGRKIGLNQQRQTTPDLPGFLVDRIAEQQRIALANGEQIIADPSIALKALSHANATFTHHEVARFLHTHTQDSAQFQAAYLKVTHSPELIRLGKDDVGRDRYTTREMLATEQRLLAHAGRMAGRMGHGINSLRRDAVLTQHRLSAEQRRAVEEITGSGDLKSLVGIAGSGKSTALAATREIWQGQGYTVKGAALAGIAAENLEIAAGIHARTLASYELAWSGGRDPLTINDVLVIDEAGMIGTRQLERVLAVAEKARAKVVLVGDPAQLQAIEAGAPFRTLSAEHGISSLTEVHRQSAAWQRVATGQLAGGQTGAALNAYKSRGGVIPAQRREDARNALLARWAHDARREPEASRMVLAYTRDEVRALNFAVRALRQQAGQLGHSHDIATAQGKRPFAVHDRIRFMRNEKTLGVKNGSLGTIERIEFGVLQIKLDGTNAVRLAVDTKYYKHLDHGYAVTVHKAQGTTVDRCYVLATPHFDRHTAYVALSRHRNAATLFYASDDFGGRQSALTAEMIHANLTATLSRARPKELAHDYLEREIAADAARPKRLLVQPSFNDIDTRQQRAAERWAARRKVSPTPGISRIRDLGLTREGPEEELDL